MTQEPTLYDRWKERRRSVRVPDGFFERVFSRTDDTESDRTPWSSLILQDRRVRAAVASIACLVLFLRIFCLMLIFLD